MKDIKYPARYDLQQAFKEFCQRNWLDKFAQEQGILLSNVSHEGMAEFLSGLFFEYAQLEQIRQVALQIDNNKTLYGFRVLPNDAMFSLSNMIDDHREQVVDHQNEMKIKALISCQLGDNEAFRGTVEYLQQKPGRVQFLQGTERSFNYFIRHVDDSEWEVLVDCGRSNDGRLIEEWIHKNLPRYSNIIKIDQNYLTTEQTIRFFDDLGTEGAGSGWRLSQVKRIVLRRDSGSDGEEEEERIETSENVLSGITQAILEGTELRNNSFVKQCEEGGYRFTAMTYEYESIDNPFVKEIRAEFKNRPKVFEVSLQNYSQRGGLNGLLDKRVMLDDSRVEVLSAFWTKAKRVFDTLTSSVTK